MSIKKHVAKIISTFNDNELYPDNEPLTVDELGQELVKRLRGLTDQQCDRICNSIELLYVPGHVSAGEFLGQELSFIERDKAVKQLDKQQDFWERFNNGGRVTLRELRIIAGNCSEQSIRRMIDDGLEYQQDGKGKLYFLKKYWDKYQESVSKRNSTFTG